MNTMNRKKERPGESGQNSSPFTAAVKSRVPSEVWNVIERFKAHIGLVETDAVQSDASVSIDEVANVVSELSEHNVTVGVTNATNYYLPAEQIVQAFRSGMGVKDGERLDPTAPVAMELLLDIIRLYGATVLVQASSPSRDAPQVQEPGAAPRFLLDLPRLGDCHPTIGLDTRQAAAVELERLIRVADSDDEGDQIIPLWALAPEYDLDNPAMNSGARPWEDPDSWSPMVKKLFGEPDLG